MDSLRRQPVIELMTGLKVPLLGLIYGAAYGEFTAGLRKAGRSILTSAESRQEGLTA